MEKNQRTKLVEELKLKQRKEYLDSIERGDPNAQNLGRMYYSTNLLYVHRDIDTIIQNDILLFMMKNTKSHMT